MPICCSALRASLLDLPRFYARKIRGGSRINMHLVCGETTPPLVTTNLVGCLSYCGSSLINFPSLSVVCCNIVMRVLYHMICILPFVELTRESLFGEAAR